MSEKTGCIILCPFLSSVHSMYYLSWIFYPLLSLHCVNEICCCSVFSLRPASVVERLICHAIIGKNPHKERIMRVDVTANFIAPLTKFSTREISFTSYQVLAGIESCENNAYQ